MKLVEKFDKLIAALCVVGVMAALFAIGWLLFYLPRVDVKVNRVDIDHNVALVTILHWDRSNIIYSEYLKEIPLCSLDSVKTAEKERLKRTVKALRGACK